jgi:hypothetical protein
MPRSKKKKTDQPISATWKFISALGGIGSIIAILLAIVPIWQAERDRNEQARYEATLQAYNEQELRIIQAQATLEFLNSPNLDLFTTATAMAQEYYEVQATATQYVFQNPGSSPTPSGFDLDIVFAFDVSASTLESRNDFILTSQRIMEAIFRQSSTSKFGVVVFGNGTELLTHSDEKDEVEKSLAIVGDVPASNRTSLFEGIFLSYQTLASEQRDYRNKTIMVFTDGQDTRVQNSTIELSQYVGNRNVNLLFVVPISFNDGDALQFIEMWKSANFKNVEAFRLDGINPSAIAESLIQ